MSDPFANNYTIEFASHRIASHHHFVGGLYALGIFEGRNPTGGLEKPFEGVVGRSALAIVAAGDEFLFANVLEGMALLDGQPLEVFGRPKGPAGSVGALVLDRRDVGNRFRGGGGLWWHRRWCVLPPVNVHDREGFQEMMGRESIDRFLR